jgi:murein L,D-transpeptidase YcbB/YkuD
MLTLCVFSQASIGQSVTEQLRMRVEQLRANGELQLGDVSIAAVALIPEVYERRAFAANWTREEQLVGLIELVEESYDEGLNPDEYHYAAIQQARQELFGAASILPERRADLDLILTDSLIRVGYHLRFGKVDPEQLDSDWNLDRELLAEDPVATIQEAIDADSLTEFREELMPRGFFYARLTSALAEYRAIEAAGGWPSIDSGPTLRPGASDERVPGGCPSAAIWAIATSCRVETAMTRYWRKRSGIFRNGTVSTWTAPSVQPLSPR